MANGTVYEDLPDRSGKIKKTVATDYGKIAKAMGDMINKGINITLVDINNSDFSFRPDPDNNSIMFGMKAMLNISDETVKNIIDNRPYTSIKDFINKVKPSKQVVISLIKGGAFDKMIDRKECMVWYIWESCNKKSRITLQNMGGLIKYKLLPEDTEERIVARRVYEFNRYLKTFCKDTSVQYKLDERAINFLVEMGYDHLINDGFTIGIKEWDKYYQFWMDVFRKWIAADKDNILNELNYMIFKEDWNKYAKGTLSAWEMEVLCFYYNKHELLDVNNKKYGFVDFNSLTEEPIVEKSFEKNGKTINIYKLSKICGTCISKNKNKSTVTLLTTTGVVNVKFRKEYFALFDKQISEYDADGKKHVAEKSWFNRGSMIVVNGMRSGDNFIVKKYASTEGHQLYKINKIYDNGDISLISERYSPEGA